MAAENPPTERKLARLREHGIVPYSRVATFAILNLLLIACLVIGYNRLVTIREIIEKGELDKLSHEFWIFLVPAIVTIMGVFLAIMLQTKFLLIPKLVLPQIARINLFSGRFSIVNIFSRVSCGVAELVIFSIISALMVYLAFITVVQVFNLSLGEVLPEYRKFILGVLPVLALACLICIVPSILISRLLFRRRNSMTREELELEERGE